MKRRQLLKLFLTETGASAIACLPIATSAAKPGRKPGRKAGNNSIRRRVRRRRIRRVVYRNMRVYSLPYGCSVTRVRGGVTFYHCRGIWYRPVYQGTTIIYVVDNIDSGANTEVEFEE